ncbi:MAG: hypothetical protein NXY57DRAFT_14588 [Lentinula lateritia]|uniref:Uncharacterized protein n=1 Tax=Lentinula lateritia TaxID=40482 RepID=A0ABQ8VGS1_9AGAR|nr:MAG: hypothetical protein NXY57DRAFT_14588 [Lentinula lateritia]KAJ4489262.1 hypothetical protein C8R41DRAFT_835494 [Lentinula lateritia]
MSVSTPTLIPRPQLFPRLLPTPPHPPQTYPLPKSHSFPANSASLWTSEGQSTSNAGEDSTSNSGRSLVGIHGHLNAKRNLQREMDDLSEEENELDELSLAIHQRGFSFLVPIGKTLTVSEEKNDADEDESEDSVSAASASGGPPSVLEDDGDGENDLDASMEDMDDSMNNEDDEDDEDNDGMDDEEDLDDG